MCRANRVMEKEDLSFRELVVVGSPVVGEGAEAAPLSSWDARFSYDTLGPTVSSLVRSTITLCISVTISR